MYAGASEWILSDVRHICGVREYGHNNMKICFEISLTALFICIRAFVNLLKVCTWERIQNLIISS